MEDRLKAHVDERADSIEMYVDERLERATKATAAEIGALHTDIRQVEARLSARIDAQGVRIDRHAALLQSGARQLMPTVQNQEELSRLWEQLDERGSNLEKRLFALE